MDKEPARAFEATLVTPSDGSRAGVVVTCGQRRVLFDCGSGLQRIATEKKLKLTRLTDLLFTRLDAETLGGLGGMLLTVADLETGRLEAAGGTLSNGKSLVFEVNLHGPPGLANYVHALRHVYKRPNSLIKVNQLDAKGTGRPIKVGGAEGQGESGLQITPVVLWPETGIRNNCAAGEAVTGSGGNGPSPNDARGRGELEGQSSIAQQSHKRRRVQARDYSVPRNFGTFVVASQRSCCGDDKNTNDGDATGIGFDDAAASVNANLAISYILRAPAPRGKFLVAKALALGVKKGPDFGKLTRGESVVSTSGRTVTPDECMEGAEPDSLMAIIACPSLEHLPALLENQELQDLGKNNGLHFIIHLAPQCVVSDDRYKKWAAAFEVETPVKHILVNDMCSNHQVFASSANIQSLLSDKVDNSLFAMDISGRQKTEATSCYSDFSFSKDQGRCAVGDLTQKIVILPKKARGIHAPEDSNDESISGSAGIISTPGGDAKVTTVQDHNVPEDGLSITFLGTGSALPSKYRNVSAILLRTSDSSCALLDCGEGTDTQLIRVFGREKALALIADQLKLVWISHMHADHHLGVLGILSLRRRLASERSSNAMPPLHIVGPDSFLHFIQDCAMGDPSIGDNYVFTPIQRSSEYISRTEAQVPALTDGQEGSVAASLGEVLHHIGIKSLTNVPVIHCFNSYGLVLDLSAGSGQRLVYSGDTRPCQKLVDHGKGARVLIHEATFEEEKIGEALAKKHSTTREAVGVGNRMGAEFTILTHFSQRYPKGFDSTEEGTVQAEDTTQVVVASDMMVISSDNLHSAVQVTAKVVEIISQL